MSFLSPISRHRQKYKSSCFAGLYTRASKYEESDILFAKLGYMNCATCSSFFLLNVRGVLDLVPLFWL